MLELKHKQKFLKSFNQTQNNIKDKKENLLFKTEIQS